MIMGSLSSLASSEKTSDQINIDNLIAALTTTGQDDKLTGSVGKYLNLPEKSDVKLLYLRPNGIYWASRACDLVFLRDSDNATPHPDSFVLFDKRKNGNQVTIYNYRFDLTGSFISAHAMNAMDDDSGKPIRGSGKDVDLNVSDKSTREDAQKLMDFWLSGKYKKYVIHMPIPTSKSTQ